MPCESVDGTTPAPPAAVSASGEPKHCNFERCTKLLPVKRRPSKNYCDTNCRSGAYRLRKQQRSTQERSAEGTQGASGAVPKWMDLESLEKLVDVVLDKRAAREAEQKSQEEQSQRIDLRTQVTALRPPADAVGYRLVLPMQGADERPRLSPKSREGRRNWYSLTPFRYPEDARLTDGTWYRLLWVDRQGRHIKSNSSASSGIPGLYYFVGPPTRAAAQTAAESASVPVTPSAAHSRDESVSVREELEALLRARAAKERKRQKLEEHRAADQQWHEDQRRKEEQKQRDMAQQMREQEMEKRILHQFSAMHSQTGLQLQSLASRPVPSAWPTVLMGILTALPAVGSLILSILNRQKTAELEIKSALTVDTKTDAHQTKVTQADIDRQLTDIIAALSKLNESKQNEPKQQDEKGAEKPVTETHSASTVTEQSVSASDTTGTIPEAQKEGQNKTQNAVVEPTPASATHQPEWPNLDQVSWDSLPLREEQRKRIISVALDEDQSVVLHRELIAYVEQLEKNPDLSAETAFHKLPADIQRILSDPIEGAAFMALRRALATAPLANPSGDYPQPAHIPPLSDFEKQRARAIINSSDQFAHFDYVLSRQSALLHGKIPPPQPKGSAGFNREKRRALEQFLRDARVIALVHALLQEQTNAADASRGNPTPDPV